MSFVLPPAVTPAMLDPVFWLDRAGIDGDAMLLPDEIPAFNLRVHDILGIPHVLDLPDTLDAADVEAWIAQYAPPEQTRYGSLGQPLDAAYFAALLANATPLLPDPVPVRFGLIVRRASVRAFPTHAVITSRPYDFALDRIQETTVDVGWPVAALAASQDRRWLFCLTPLYWGWVPVDAVAFAARGQVADYLSTQPFVVTVASRGLVSLADGGGVTPQMGTELPFDEQVVDDVYNVIVPARAEDGSLRLQNGAVPRQSGEFAPGTLPCTLRTVLTQAFRLLGEPYAWGGSRMGIFGRDCSRLVRDSFAVTGVHLPRNGFQQAQVGIVRAEFAPDLSSNERKMLLVENVPPGAILVMPGHVMLYLGHIDGEPYAIHSTALEPYGGVIVSDLTLGDPPLLMRLTRAVTIGE